MDSASFGYEAQSLMLWLIPKTSKQAASTRCFTIAGTPSKAEVGLMRGCSEYSDFAVIGSASLRSQHRLQSNRWTFDADLLVTDACPADVLLQRLGRLHRHRIGTKPTAVVINPGALDQYLLPQGRAVGRTGQSWPWVYNNLLSVRATLEWLRTANGISIPEDCRTLVERATHADYLHDLATSIGGSWLNLWRELFDNAARKTQLAETSLVDWQRAYREALVNECLPTRLGDGTITIAVRNLASPFTTKRIEALPIPARWLRNVVPPEEPIDAIGDRLSVGSQNFSYTRLGLRRT
jgi:CRISPR-associated endonuclease/helicase Cas3